MNTRPQKQENMPATREAGSGSPLAELRSEMDRLFDRFFRGSWMSPADRSAEGNWPAGQFMPSVDLSEGEEQITIRAEVPGMEPDDIDITVSGNVLTIHGEKRNVTEDEGDDYYHCERCFGSFTRSIELPPTADLDNIDAEQRNGVLTVRVQKAPAAKKQRIEVKSAQRELAGSS